MCCFNLKLIYVSHINLVGVYRRGKTRFAKTHSPADLDSQVIDNRNYNDMVPLKLSQQFASFGQLITS